MSQYPALIIIFNHRYDKNIDILEKIYRHRFRNIFFLVPFYDGSNPNVIPVYENSYYFQGYIAQGYRHYSNSEYSHYLFVADDLLLNPEINEDNYRDFFHLADDEGFLPEVFSLHNLTNNATLLFDKSTSILQSLSATNHERLFWWRTVQAIQYSPAVSGAECVGQVPGYPEALLLLQRHGYSVQPLDFRDVYGACPAPSDSIGIRKWIGWLIRRCLNLIQGNKRFTLKYPLVGSYSDIVIVPQSSARQFAHYCGVFAANRLFVEFAIPTALLLTCQKVVCEPDINRRGAIYWLYTEQGRKEYNDAMASYNSSLEHLVDKFPSQTLYIHPIKLSQWNINLPLKS